MQDSRIQKIVIVGGGTAGWMTAAMLVKMMSKKLSITLVESDKIPTIGVGEATIPPIQTFNEVLGLDEDDFIRKTQATFKLGIEFENWGGLGQRYMHDFGAIGHDVGAVSFYQYWLRARKEGDQSDLWDYSLNTRTAMAGKFARMDTIEGTPFPGITYAYHFDAGLYAKNLCHYSEQLGVKHIEGKIIKTNLRSTDGFIESVLLENGDEIAADLFIDCSGFGALLIEQALHIGYEDWSNWLPCDRAVVMPSENVGPMRPYTQSMARPAGWQWRIPLQHRTGNGHVYCSDYMSEDEATGILLDNVEGQPLAEPRVMDFKAGRRKKFWVKNCIALGLSSGFMEPLESTSIHLFQMGIRKLIASFPNKNFDQVDIDEYNRRLIFEFERIRDFIIMHYHITERSDTSFWDRCRLMDVPDTLKQKMDQFKANGRIFREDNELFAEVSWLQVMIGQGVIPADYHPVADQMPPEQLQEYLANVKTIITGAVKRMPSQEQFIARHCAAARQ